MLWKTRTHSVYHGWPVQSNRISVPAVKTRRSFVFSSGFLDKAGRTLYSKKQNEKCMPSRRRWSFYEIQEPFPRGTEHAHRPVLPVCDHPAGLSHAPALSDLLRFRRQRRAEHHQAAVRLPLPARSRGRSGHHPGALPPGGDGRTPDCERDPGRHRPLLPPHRHTVCPHRGGHRHRVPHGGALHPAARRRFTVHHPVRPALRHQLFCAGQVPPADGCGRPPLCAQQPGNCHQPDLRHRQGAGADAHPEPSGHAAAVLPVLHAAHPGHPVVHPQELPLDRPPRQTGLFRRLPEELGADAPAVRRYLQQHGHGAAVLLLQFSARQRLQHLQHVLRPDHLRDEPVPQQHLVPDGPDLPHRPGAVPWPVRPVRDAVSGLCRVLLP